MAGGDPYDDKVMLAAVVSLSIVIFFALFLHIYARWLIRRHRPVARRVVFREPLHLRSVAAFPGHTTEIRLSITGVDPKVVASLPVFVYKAREHEHGLECVVCLNAMEEDDGGRLLPACRHAFHVGCIDAWLTSHATCPICRAPVEIMGEPAQVGDTVSAVVECEAAVQVEPGNANEESCVVDGAAAEGDVGVDTPSLGPATATHTIKEDSSPSSSSSSPASSSFGSSLKRMLSRGRS